MRRWAVGLGLLVAGCGGPGDDYLPLRVGRWWEYTLYLPPARHTDTYRVERELPVAGRMGYELKSDRGVLRLGWKDGVLYCSQAAGSRFYPALPLYTPKDRVWEGRVDRLGRVVRASASVRPRAKADKITLPLRTLNAQAVDVRMDLNGKRYELTTWFAKGVGIVAQEERVDGRLRMQMRLLTEGE